MLTTFEPIENLNERKKLHCVSCRRKTTHRVEVKYRGYWHDSDHNMDGGETYAILRCGACDNVCYETMQWDSETYYHDENGDIQSLETFVQYPAPVSEHFSFNTESIPHKLTVILNEMLYSLAGSKMRLATTGLRMAVEFIVRDNKCAGRTLVQKIDDLRAKGLIDDDQKDMLHQIRKRGNAGAHEARGMSASELVAGMSIVEGLLEKLYNGPARHQATIKRAKMLLADA